MDGHGGLMARGVLAALFLASTWSTASASNLTEHQKIGMFLHGSWSWSIDNCEDITRNKRYWRFLIENGRFSSFTQIHRSVDGEEYRKGWNFMQRKSKLWGNDEACDYASDKWPAMLWRKK